MRCCDATPHRSTKHIKTKWRDVSSHIYVDMLRDRNRSQKYKRRCLKESSAGSGSKMVSLIAIPTVILLGIGAKITIYKHFLFHLFIFCVNKFNKQHKYVSDSTLSHRIKSFTCFDRTEHRRAERATRASSFKNNSGKCLVIRTSGNENPEWDLDVLVTSHYW